MEVKNAADDGGLQTAYCRLRTLGIYLWHVNPSLENISLMTDGGSENFNVNVAEFIRSVDHIPINQIKALANGWPSNSMAEALNQTIKTYYLNHMDIRTQAGLEKALEMVIEDFAYKRPHGKLKGLTPHQVYTGQRPEQVSFVSQLQSSRKARVIMNQNHSCSGKCKFK